MIPGDGIGQEVMPEAIRVLDTEPYTTPVQRLLVREMGVLPIEWLL